MIRSSALLFAVILVPAGASAQIKRTQDPALSPDGAHLAFSWQGDLWRVPATGGRAERLTVHPAADGFPVWSPDGARIVFHSNRFGSYDLFSVSAQGTDLRRLTYESSDEYATDFTPDGRTIVGYTNAWGRLGLFRVPAEGGALLNLASHPLHLYHWPRVSPDGQSVTFVLGGSPGSWRRPELTGSSTGELWTAPMAAPLTHFQRLTDNERVEAFPVPVTDGRTLVISNRDGATNLWALGPGSKAQKLTPFTQGTMRALTATRDGKVAAFQRDSTLWVWREGQGAQELRIEAPTDRNRNSVQDLTLATGVRGADVSPDGKRAVIEVRGDLYLIPEAGGTTRPLTQTPRPESNPLWLDDKTILFVAGAENGRRELRTTTLDGQVSPFLTHALDLTSPDISPDRKLLAFQLGGDQLVVTPLADGKPGPQTVVARGDFGVGGASFTWAPASAHLAVVRPLSRSVEALIVPATGGEPLASVPIGRDMSAPEFSANGETIVFSAIQGVDFAETRDTLSPMYVLELWPRQVKFTEDDLDALDAPKDGKKPEPKVRVHQPGLLQRLRKVTSVSATPLAITSAGLVYANIGGQFSTFSLEDGQTRPVASVTGPVGGVILDEPRNRMALLQGGRISRLDLRNGAVTPINFSARTRVDLAEEERALFEEIWWAMDRRFYDPKLHGRDWAALREEFAGLLPYVTSRTDFYALMNEMVQRLESSHQGAQNPPEFRPETSEDTAWLGVEWDWAEMARRGEYVVGSVYPNSPAAHPESELVKGDRVLTVDGIAATDERPLAALLDRKAGRKVRLVVERNSRDVEVVIRPASRSGLSGLLYDHWVVENRRRVHELSGGRLGYTHIEGMDVAGLDTFLRDIQTEMEGRYGLVIDVRYNGGGFTGQAILNTMLKRPWLQRTSRERPGFQISENQWRGNALEAPAIALINESSFSNAEIFAEGFRRLGFGKLVGEPTAGGVIGTGSLSLWDGGSIRVPGSGAYALDGENLEGNGRRPDIQVPFDPNAWAVGRDPQLERAVKELLASLE